MARKPNNKSTTRSPPARSSASKAKAGSKGSGNVANPVTGSWSVAGGPSISGGPRGQVTFSNTEFVADVTNSNIGGPVNILTINPGHESTFTWLSRVSAGYEMYRFLNLTVQYTPTCSSTTAGLIVGAFEYDAADAPPTSKVQLSGFDGAGRTNVWSKMGWSMTCPKAWYYTSPSANAADSRLTDVARFFLGVYNGAPTTVVGELSVSYTIQFAKPEFTIFNGMENSILSSSTLSNLAGTSETTLGEDLCSLHSPASGVLELVSKVTGNFQIIVASAMSSGTARSVTSSAFHTVKHRRATDQLLTDIPRGPYVDGFASGTWYSCLDTFQVALAVGDAMVFTAATVATALQIQRILMISQRRLLR